MKQYLKNIIIFLIVLSHSIEAGNVATTVESFLRVTDYVRPFSTLIGSMNNASWYQSAKIDKKFGFYIGLPISLTYISSKDRAYTSTFIDSNCAMCHELNGDSQGCKESQEYKTSTIFGNETGAVLDRAIIDMYGNVTRFEKERFSGGVPAIANIKLMPFTTLQLGFSIFYTELKLRYIGIPKISGFGFHIPGFGIQNDLSSFFPDLPFSLSIALNFSFFLGTWKPGENVTGEMKLKGLTNFAGVIAGYRLKQVEFFMECGWERSSLSPRGKVIIDKGKPEEDIIDFPEDRDHRIDIKGRNAFRLGLSSSFLFGYNPVIGINGVSEWNNTINILSFKSESDE